MPRSEKWTLGECSDTVQGGKCVYVCVCVCVCAPCAVSRVFRYSGRFMGKCIGLLAL